MKKLALILASLSAMALLTSCGNDEPKTPLKYKNGEYIAQWKDVDDKGYSEYLRLSITDDVITIVEFDGKNDKGDLKSVDTALAEEMQEAQSKNLPYKISPKLAYGKIVDSFINAKGEISAIESVAGATKTSKGFFVLYDAILQGPATTGSAETLMLPLYGEGFYRVYSADYDEYGYKEFIDITVSDEGAVKITDFTATDKDGKKREDDTETKFPFKHEEVKTKLTESFTKGGFAGVETVAGATVSSANFKVLLDTALENAIERNTEEFKMNKLKDGVYRAEMAEGENGWKDYVIAWVDNGDVKIVEYNAKNEKGSLKIADAEFAKSIAEAPATKLVPSLKPEEYHKKIITNFNSASDDVLIMENVAGATVSTNNFKIMLGQLMGYSMQNGDEEVLIVALPAEEEIGSSQAK